MNQGPSFACQARWNAIPFFFLGGHTGCQVQGHPFNAIEFSSKRTLTLSCIAFSHFLNLSPDSPSILIAMGGVAICLATLGVAAILWQRKRSKSGYHQQGAAGSAGILTHVVGTAALGGALMCAVEVLKMGIFPGIGIWASHTVTVIVAIAVVSIASFVALKRDRQLRIAMAESERRYTLLFEKSLTGAYRTSIDGTVLDCNVSFCRLFGYASREEVIGHTVDIGYFSLNDRSLFVERLREEGGLTNFEQRLRRKDGNAVWVLNNAKLDKSGDGSKPSIKGTMTDITERKCMEQELRRLAAIVRCSGDAILSVTMDGLIDTWNAGAERIFGYRTDEVLGKSIDILAPMGRTNEYRRNLARIRDGQDIENFEVRRLRKDGREITISLSLSPIPDAEGNVIGAAGIARDVTVQKRVEERLRDSEIEYRLLFASNPIPMWVFDRVTLRFLAVNHAAVRQYGYTEQEFLSLTIADIRPQETIEDLILDVSKCDQGLQRAGVWKHRRKDGTILDVEIISHDLEFRGSEAMLVAAYNITERRRAKEMLKESESRYRALFDGSPDAYWLMDEEGFLDCNSAGLAMFGLSSKTDFKHPADISPPAQPDGTPSKVAADQKIAAAFRNGKERFEWLHQRKNGEVFFADVSLAALSLSGRRVLLACIRDISERKRAEAALEFKTTLLEAQAETSIDGILVIDDAGSIVLANRQFETQFAVPQEILSAGDDFPVMKHVMYQMEDPTSFVQRAKYLYSHRYEKGIDEMKLKDGRTFDRYSAPLIDSKGLHRGRISYFRDITQRKTAEARIQHQAYFDLLTDLPNRTLLQDRLSKGLASACRTERKLAVLFLDLDHFKLINDSLGHTLGDHLLKNVAERLKGCIREQDTAARVGGDEFVIALSDVKDTADAVSTAARIVDAVRQRFSIDGHSLSTSCSIGISLFPDHANDCETLIKYADQAMSCAKGSGRNSYHLFSEDLNRHAVTQWNLDSALHLALERGEFSMVYQPQMEILSGKITGLEALIRWQHPELGMVPPNEFIPIAERNGLILPIGEWVLRTACDQAQKWFENGLPEVSVAVNVSAVQFRQEGFYDLIKRVLAQTALPPQLLELELTESLLMSNADVMVAVLRQLQGMGVRIAIDDFGTGYSSLSYLKQFRVNKLKIDRSLIRDVVVNSDDASITTAIIGMGKNLNLTVIAEGVENEEQLSFLRERQCDQIQGYLFSRPISSCETSKLLLHEQAIRDRHEGLCLSFSDCSSAFVLTGAGHNVGDPSLTSQTPEEDLSTLISGSRSIQ